MELLDSDTCIGIRRGRTEVRERRAAEPDEVATTWVTASELFYGAAKAARSDANAALVLRFLEILPVRAPDLANEQLFGDVTARPATPSLIVADADGFVAVPPLSRGATLMTRSRMCYERIPGLVLEDCLRP